METVTPLQFAHLLETVLLESNTPSFASSDLSDTDTDDTVTSPPELFPARVQQRVQESVHAQVQLGRRRAHAALNGR